MEVSNTSKNFALISGWLQRSPDKNAGSNFDVMSLPERFSSLQKTTRKASDKNAARYFFYLPRPY